MMRRYSYRATDADDQISGVHDDDILLGAN